MINGGTKGSRIAAAPQNRPAEEGILSGRGPNRTGLMRPPALHSCEAPGGAQPGIRPLCDMRGLGGRDVAVRNRRQHGGQHLSKIPERPQRRQVDPETRRRVDGSGRRRQELRGEGPQQMRLAVEQIRQRLRAQRPSHEIRHAPLGIGDAARPATRVAGMARGEAPARVARAGGKEIRVK